MVATIRAVPKQRFAPVLSVEDLSVEFRSERTWLPVLDDVSFEIGNGEVLGLVGESGSGKTVSALTVMGLLPRTLSRVTGGRVLLKGDDLLGRSDRAMSNIRGKRMSMIFQEPIRSLNPAYPVGDQVAEVVRRHTGANRADSWRRAIDLFEMVEIPSAGQRARNYPHQFSGGMCQRVMLAIALACEPELLIADEPTTALDVTVQAQVLRLLRDLQDRTGVSILLITHDLGVVAGVCDRVAIMYSGQIVETARVEALFHRPRHPYLEGLLASLPKLNQASRFDAIAGQVPKLGAWPSGCRFHPRCSHCVPGRCDVGAMSLRLVDDDHWSRCVRAEELRLAGVHDA